MAVLSTDQLADIRREFVKTLANIGITKVPINAGIQAVEDWFEANRASIGTAIEAAAPGIFTATQKKALAKMWLYSKFLRE